MMTPDGNSSTDLPSVRLGEASQRDRRWTLASLSSWVVALIFFAPIAWIAMSAFKTTGQILSVPPLFVFEPTLDNFTEMFQDPKIPKFFFNSVLLSVGSVLIAIAVSFLAAYSFSRFKPPGTDFLMFLLLSTRFVPAAAFVIPFFQLFGILNFRNTYVGLIIFYVMFSVPFSVWILKGFIDGVSQRFDETGLVNGASHRCS